MQIRTTFIGSIQEAITVLYIPLDKSARRTYTKQIYYAIREKILAGELHAGEALPPYRELSQDLAVSKNTVLSAYDMLVAEGMLRNVAGSGFYVASSVRRLMPAVLVPPQSAALTDLTIPDGAINFDNGCPALELFPRAKWGRALSAAMAVAPITALGYDLPQGRPELRLALCECLRRTQGLSCSPERIVPLPVDAHGLSPRAVSGGAKARAHHLLAHAAVSHRSHHAHDAPCGAGRVREAHRGVSSGRQF